MKTFYLTALLLAAAVNCVAEMLVNFDDGFTVSSKGCEGKVEMIPELKHNGGVLIWQSNPPKYALWRGNNGKSKPINSFTQAAFLLNVYVLPNTGIKMIALRFRDVSGEIFQVSQYRPFINVKAEKATVKFVVDTSTKVQSWGGNNDKKIDWPLRFIGGACNFYPDSRGGRLYFESLEYSIPEEL